MKIVQCNCPACGASLDIKGERKYVFCEYCGEKLYIDDEATTIVFRDEARLKEAENKAREIDIAEKRRAERQRRFDEQQQAYKKWKSRFMLSTVIGTICWVVCFVMQNYNNNLLNAIELIIFLIPFGIPFYIGYKMPINESKENRSHPKIASGVLIFGITLVLSVIVWAVIDSFIG